MGWGGTQELERARRWDCAMPSLPATLMGVEGTDTAGEGHWAPPGVCLEGCLGGKLSMHTQAQASCQLGALRTQLSWLWRALLSAQRPWEGVGAEQGGFAFIY